MFSQSMNELDCPSCGSTFYPVDTVNKKTLCGIGELCYPGKLNKSKANDCKIYYFCSPTCMSEFEKNTPRCDSVPLWKRYMKKIDATSKKLGIKGKMAHNLNRKKTYTEGRK